MTFCIIINIIVCFGIRNMYYFKYLTFISIKKAFEIKFLIKYCYQNISKNLLYL